MLLGDILLFFCLKKKKLFAFVLFCFSSEDVLLVELKHLVSSRMLGESYNRRFRSLLLCHLPVER